MGEEIKSGEWTRILDALRLAWDFSPEHIRITFDRPLRELVGPRGSRAFRHSDERTIRRRAPFVVAANGPYYGSGFTIAPGARLQDGRLTISIFRNFTKWDLIRHFRGIARGRYRYSPKIETYNARAVELSCDHPLPVHVDGKPLGTTPVRLRALPGALRVFVPKV